MHIDLAPSSRGLPIFSSVFSSQRSYADPLDNAYTLAHSIMTATRTTVAAVLSTWRSTALPAAEHQTHGGFLYIRSPVISCSAIQSRLQRTSKPAAAGHIRSYLTSSGPQRKKEGSLAPNPVRRASKIYKDADEAVADIESGSTILSAGFGLCGTAGESWTDQQPSISPVLTFSRLRNNHTSNEAPR